MTPILDRVFPLDQCCPLRARQWDAMIAQDADAYEVAARRHAEANRGEAA